MTKRGGVTIISRIGQALTRLRLSSAAEIGGLAAIVAGVWMVYEPAALIAAGLGTVLWAQGQRAGKGDQ